MHPTLSSNVYAVTYLLSAMVVDTSLKIEILIDLDLHLAKNWALSDFFKRRQIFLKFQQNDNETI